VRSRIRKIQLELDFISIKVDCRVCGQNIDHGSSLLSMKTICINDKAGRNTEKLQFYFNNLPFAVKKPTFLF